MTVVNTDDPVEEGRKKEEQNTYTVPLPEVQWA